MPAPLDHARLSRLIAAETDQFVADQPRSRELSGRARAVMPGGVSMSWMVSLLCQRLLDRRPAIIRHILEDHALRRRKGLGAPERLVRGKDLSPDGS